MRPLKHIVLIAAILIGCVGCDQTTKSLARDFLQSRATVSFLGDTVRLQYAENPGAFLSLGASLPHRWGTAVFTVGAAIVITVVLCVLLLAWKSGRMRIIALALICGGGAGNLIDRFRYDGRVIDFLNVGVGPLRTGIFNVADMALMAGAILLILQYAGGPSSAGSDRH